MGLASVRSGDRGSAMKVLDDKTVLFSASDITSAFSCEWAMMRRLDVKLGHLTEDQVPKNKDSMLKLAGAVGRDYETSVLKDFKKVPDTTVVEIDTEDKPHKNYVDNVRYWSELTIDALRKGADVVFQATFLDGDMLGFADFIVKVGDDEQGRAIYQVQDSKLARHVKITALLQLAAYVSFLRSIDIPVSDEVRLILGTGEKTTHDVRDIAPTFELQKNRVRALIDSRVQDSKATFWGDHRYTACGRCEVCAPEIERTDDVLLVAGMTSSQRTKLHSADVTTVTQLAALDLFTKIPKVPSSTLKNLIHQARAQLATRAAADGKPSVTVRNPGLLANIPPRNPGDIFFDFEGDPLDLPEDNPHPPYDWGIDYLFGVQFAPLGRVELTAQDDESFIPYWADSFHAEGQAFDDFMAMAVARRKQFPGMHIYHYAAYEKTHLKLLAARHERHEGIVDAWLRDGVLVDLYPIVKRSLWIGSRSYSIKKLEPLYMPKDESERGAVVGNAADSVVAYSDYRSLIAETGDPDPEISEAAIAKAAALKNAIIEYNRYDCRSTFYLREMLVDIASDNGIILGSAYVEKEPSEAFDPHPVYQALHSLIDDVEITDRAPAHTALAIAASATDYFWREDKKFWWEHHARLGTEDVADWATSRGVIILDPENIEVLPASENLFSSPELGWHRPKGRSNTMRKIRAKILDIAPGTSVKKNEQLHAAYSLDDAPSIEWTQPPKEDAFYAAHDRTIMLTMEDGWIEFYEHIGKSTNYFAELPLALTPGEPIRTDQHKNAVRHWGGTIYNHFVDNPIEFPKSHDEPFTVDFDDHPMSSRARAQIELTRTDVNSFDLIDDPAFDLLLRRTPRSTNFPGDPAAKSIEQIVAALGGMENSFIAVQGPPGTGKTFTGSHVISRLVNEKNWRVGVVAQSHSTVENVLEALIDRGLKPEQIGKKSKFGEGDKEQPWTVLSPARVPEFVAEGDSRVLGGTAWDFADLKRFPEKTFDLLVIDEAGQFSLANLIATSVTSKRVLLLGDPQQLPQVTTGTHAEPVDVSALGWLSEGHDVLPSELGVFLPESWRMSPELCATVSELSYDNKLHAVTGENAPQRSLEQTSPGLHYIPVPHEGRTLWSPEEAERVVLLVEELIGREWKDSANDSYASGKPLEQEEIIVVAAYNAQVDLIEEALANAGYSDIRVGTVDRFQGREAAVAIVSLAASSATEIPRGIEFLLMKNRLNVAISRAKWSAYLIASPALREFLPSNEEALKLLSRYITLTNNI